VEPRQATHQGSATPYFRSPATSHTRRCRLARDAGRWDAPRSTAGGSHSTPVTETPDSGLCRGCPNPKRLYEYQVWDPLIVLRWPPRYTGLNSWKAVDQKSNIDCSVGHSWATLGGDKRLLAVTRGQPLRACMSAPRILPSWSCEFDSRHPLHSVCPGQRAFNAPMSSNRGSKKQPAVTSLGSTSKRFGLAWIRGRR
jgi:hypothetical protein